MAGLRAVLLAERDRRRGSDRAAAAAERRLIDFVRLMWGVVEPAHEFRSAWPLEAWCDHLEAVAAGQITRLLGNIPPGFTKSLTTNSFFPAWLWGPRRRPSERLLSASYAQHLPVRDNIRFRHIITSRLYRELWGDAFQPAPEQFSVVTVANDKRGWKLATSIGGVGTGERADFFLIDDPNNPLESESDAVMRTTNNWFREVVPDRLNDLEKSAIVVIQQRTAENDVSGVILSEGLDYVHCMIPMEHDPRRHCVTPVWQDPRTEDGELAWPERFPPEVVERLKREKGKHAFCTPAEAPVLMADLSLKPIGRIKAGDKIVGFKIGNSEARTRLQETRVISVSVSVRPLVRITLESGEVIRCTADHKWWTGRHDPSHPAYAPAYAPDAKWPGNRGNGRSLFRVCSPRLPELSGRMFTSRERVVSIEPDKPETVYGLETTTGNYVVWGLASSNSSQYQQSPEPRGGGIFKRDWWKLWPPDGEEFDSGGQPLVPLAFPPMECVVASLDTAYTTRQENDWSAMTVWGAWRDTGARPLTAREREEERKPWKYGDVIGQPKIMLRGAWQKRLELHDLVEEVLKTCRKHKVDILLIEAKASGHSVAQEIARLSLREEFGVKLVNPGAQDKTARAYAVQHLFEAGLVYAPDRAWADAVISECAVFPHGKHDDLVDSSVQALRFLRDTGMALVLPEAEERALEDYGPPGDPDADRLYDV